MVAALAGAGVLAGAVAVFGWICGWPLAGAVAVGASRFGATPAAPAGAGGVLWLPGTGSAWPTAGAAADGVTAVGVACTCMTFIAAGFVVGLLTSAAWLGLSGWFGLV